MVKTIKELADELNVSKDKVKYQVRKLPSEFTSKENGITHIKDIGIEVIRTKLFNKKTSELPSLYLEKELAFLQNELKDKNNQIEKLHQLLENQQVLNKQMLEEKQQLKIQVSELTTEPKKSWFRKIFG
jgi:DNA-binding Lrp family transcriptional regulator